MSPMRPNDAGGTVAQTKASVSVTKGLDTFVGLLGNPRKVELTEKGHKLSQLIEEREHHLREIAALRHRNVALAPLAARLAAEICEMRDSTSWRMTAPLRSMKSWLLKLLMTAAVLKTKLKRTPRRSAELIVDPQPESLAAWREILGSSGKGS